MSKDYIILFLKTPSHSLSNPNPPNSFVQCLAEKRGESDSGIWITFLIIKGFRMLSILDAFPLLLMVWCLLPCKDQARLAKVLLLPVRQSFSTIHSPTIWSRHGTQTVHQGYNHGGGLPLQVRVWSRPLSRGLVEHTRFQRKATVRCPVDPESFRTAQLTSQHLKIQTIIYIIESIFHRCDTRLPDGHLSTPRLNPSH